MLFHALMETRRQVAPYSNVHIMNKIQYTLFAFVLLLFTACAGSKDVVYLQDLANQEMIKTQKIGSLKFQQGDKLTLVVTSHATPELAMQYNLTTYQSRLGMEHVSSTRDEVGAYVVGEDGTIKMPVLGTIAVAGLTLQEVTDKVQTQLRGAQLRDAVVVGQAYGQYITILGEVNHPGRIAIDRNRITLLEALGQAGDLTIKGKRDQVMVVRQEDGQAKNYVVDLRSKNLFRSPVYNLQQNDVVYVVPNKVRTNDATANGNALNSVGTWISLASFALTLGVLIFK